MNERLEGKPPEEILRWAIDTFSPNIGMASSFGAEDVLLIDLVSRQAPAVRVFTLDTGRLHEETYELMEQVRTRYGISIETYFPAHEAVERLERGKGLYSFRESVENRRECCDIRKVEPLRRALAGLAAWITGLRRDQAVTRTETQAVEWDETNGLVKVNPLVEWTNEQVWDYVRAHNVPYNTLHDQGFPSIGCAPCTRAIQPGEDIRAGRWWWEHPEYKECGLHR
ncbi:MAG: phosphoadenosine phosphosulfate reductase [Chloroflexi bacterium RBG_16_68_14]|nr:MAG: phosphoadenosine phosphosulfate reductase [Chloroflexi bacterium RBG_16_68_14]